MLNSFGEYVRMTRKQKKMNVRELAQRIGVSTGHLSNIENGKPEVSIKLDALEKLQKELEFLPLLPEEEMDERLSYRLNKAKIQYQNLVQSDPSAAELLLTQFEQGIDWFLKK
ncbi:helix-turn-helix domain-containing protein [Fictibacillus phosphorivorans]|uniref:helix-turn-helix domain-containing protein n=1 Tax=Fictibacillus phosphorivorans TaxID=1221500 RepID=UPI003CF99F4D